MENTNGRPDRIVTPHGREILFPLVQAKLTAFVRGMVSSVPIVQFRLAVVWLAVVERVATVEELHPVCVTRPVPNGYTLVVPLTTIASLPLSAVLQLRVAEVSVFIVFVVLPSLKKRASNFAPGTEKVVGSTRDELPGAAIMDSAGAMVPSCALMLCVAPLIVIDPLNDCGPVPAGGGMPGDSITVKSHCVPLGLTSELSGRFIPPPGIDPVVSSVI